MASHVGMHLRGIVMIVVMIVEVGVHERRRQRTSLQCDREPDGEKAPTHERILLEGLVVYRPVGPELV